jgi:uncharacterized NAD(P)/FAD-binding protein YdhS
MLSDNARKVLRILWNHHRDKWARMNIPLICKLAVRSEQQVQASMKELLDAGHIEVREGELRVIQAWEDEPMTINTDYSRFTG